MAWETMRAVDWPAFPPFLTGRWLLYDFNQEEVSNYPTAGNTFITVQVALLCSSCRSLLSFLGVVCLRLERRLGRKLLIFLTSTTFTVLEVRLLLRLLHLPSLATFFPRRSAFAWNRLFIFPMLFHQPFCRLL